MTKAVLGVIGGSGVYDLPGLEGAAWQTVESPWGEPSDQVRVGEIDGLTVVFLPRHGRGHRFSPSDINYRANIYALKSLGVRQVIAISACGSLREDFAPGHVVVPDQVVDRTKDERGRSFFGDGLVAHVSVADPFCAELNQIVADAVADAGGTVHRGGTYITIEGPRFSTRAESALYRAWGMDIIGMTTSPEAFLAREAEMCYSVMAHVTDYDVWHEVEEDVSVDMVVRTLNANVRLAQRALLSVVERLAGGIEDCACYHALETALITDPSRIPAETRQRLDLLVGKYLERR